MIKGSKYKTGTLYALAFEVILMLLFVYCIIFRLKIGWSPEINGFAIFNLLGIVGVIFSICSMIVGKIFLNKMHNNSDDKIYFRYLMIFSIITLVLSIGVLAPILTPNRTDF